jgi:hypothetical protein
MDDMTKADWIQFEHDFEMFVDMYIEAITKKGE